MIFVKIVYDRYCLYLFIQLYVRSLHRWLFLGQKTYLLLLTTGKHQNSVRVYSRLLPLKIWSHAFERWRIDTTTLYVISANARKEFGSSCICYRFSAPSVSKATTVFTGTNVALLRYHSWIDNWKVEMRPLFSHLYMRFIAFLSFKQRSYYFREGYKSGLSRLSVLILF